MQRTLRLGAAALVLLLAGCSKQDSDINKLVVTLPDGTKIQADMMVRELDLTRGMMFRDELPEGHGMLLVHGRESKYPAFTYQVKMPLDMIWMDKNLRIVEIIENIPPCTGSSAKGCPFYGGKEWSRYVLELNAGAVKKYGLQLGDVLNF